MLITLLIPTAGTARVLGYDVVKDAREVRKRIGYVFGGDRGLYERLSAPDNLRHFAELYAVDPSQQKSPYPLVHLLIRRRDLPPVFSSSVLRPRRA
jgi:ABC-2 type transport system ATP-binding protein